MFKIKKISVGLISLCSLVLFVIGCSSPPGELFPQLEKPLIWPAPPENPRIKYIGEISTEADLKEGISWLESLTELVFGKKKIGILVGPYAVATDNDERLFVADASQGRVHSFDLKNRKHKQFADIGNEQELQMPVALAVIGDRIYVVDSVLHKICVFNQKGKYILSFGQERLKRPTAIAYCALENNIYVTDTASHKINIFRQDGSFVKELGERGTKPGLFNFPTQLWVDKEGRLYVSDTLNYRIQIFTKKGKFVKMFGRQGDRAGNFAHSGGVATDSFGHIYVVDRQFENIQVFDSNGVILMAFGQEGSGPGEFWLPGGIYIDIKNKIYIADSFNKRIQIFKFLEEAGQ